ncbi:Dienelactone hydrolase family protein [Mycena sanguinolenta]|uniref:Dienelactone hydrolase family protein n=1 Tax=Mycena sanguinolenta TaxID=230812 RepID=A0A8H6YYS3_9AGAR|nr:Dienelactone hydrolase family protein [Mycena sanguinolenta]
MPTLDKRGIIAAAQLGGYIPILVLSLFFTVRYALRRDAGFLFMSIFSAIRIAGGALIVAGELTKNPSTSLFTAAYILFHAGLAILMLSTLGFLGLAGQHTYSEYLHTTRMFVSKLYTFHYDPLTGICRAIAFFVIVAMALAIAGGILGSPVAPTQGHIGDILRKTAAALYGALYLVLVVVHIRCWADRWEMRSYRRRLLGSVLCALPVLGARVVYEILAAWSSSDLFGLQLSSNATLAMFQPVTGKWILFLALGFVCEYVVAALYMLSSTVLASQRRRRHHRH